MPPKLKGRTAPRVRKAREKDSFAQLRIHVPSYWTFLPALLLSARTFALNTDLDPPERRVSVGHPHILIVYHICGTRLHNWTVSRSKWATYAAWCTEDEHNDCYETVPYLDFIINNYDRTPADIIVWAHAHDTSWHYRRNFWDQLQGLVGSEYFETVPMGGVYDVWSWEPRRENKWYRRAFPYLYAGTTMNNIEMMYNASHPCCSSYFFKWELVWNRPLSDYKLLREQSIQWSRRASQRLRNPGGICGRVTEYNWHFMFLNKTTMPTRKEWEKARAAEKRALRWKA